MAHKIYDNFYLSNEVEDQFNSTSIYSSSVLLITLSWVLLV